MNPLAAPFYERRLNKYNNPMTPDTFASRYNLDAIEDAYQRWRQDANSVDESWRLFFEGFELGLAQSRPAAMMRSKQSLIRLIDAYRGLGHLLARLDPLSLPPVSMPFLELSEFGFTDNDLDRTFDTSFFLGMKSGTLRQLIAALRETYCRTLGVEYMHIQDTRFAAGFRNGSNRSAGNPATAAGKSCASSWTCTTRSCSRSSCTRVTWARSASPSKGPKRSFRSWKDWWTMPPTAM